MTLLKSISIHAPYKRVRRQPKRLDDRFRSISIHAPYKRVRLKGIETINCPADYFNPRTLQESATVRLADFMLTANYFNPRTLQESATQP